MLADGLERDLGKILTRPFFWSVARVTFDESDATGLGRYNVFGAGDEAALPTDDPLVQRFLERLVADFAAAKRPVGRTELQATGTQLLGSEPIPPRPIAELPATGGIPPGSFTGLQALSLIHI